MPVTSDMTSTETAPATSVDRKRATLSVPAGSVPRVAVASGSAQRARLERPNDSGASAGQQQGVVPLKRLTAGRKELKIDHDGATYLLRITKSNKLILTKADDTPRVD